MVGGQDQIARAPGIAQQAQGGVSGRAVEVDVARLVVVEEWDDAWFAILDTGHVGDHSTPQKLLDSVGDRSIRVATDPRTIGSGAWGSMVGASALIVHGASL